MTWIQYIREHPIPRRMRFRAGLLHVPLVLLTAGNAAAQDPAARASADTITFAEAIDIASARNTQLARARDDVGLQGALTTREWMDFLPQLSLSSGGTRTFGRSFSQQEGEILSETTDFIGVEASLSFDVFNGFERLASLERAGLEAEASALRLQRTRQDVVFFVVDGFTLLLQNRALAAAAEEELAVQEDLLRQVEGLVEVGRVPISDLYQQQAARAEAEAALVEARRDLRLAEMGLIQLLQLDPGGDYSFTAPGVEEALVIDAATGDSLGGAPVPPDGPLAELRLPGGISPADSAAYDVLLDAALERRADLDALELDVAASQQGVRAAKAGYWPALSLSFGYGSDWSSTALQPVPGTGIDPRTVTVTPDDGGDPVVIPVPGTGSDPTFRRPDLLDQLDARRGGFVRLGLELPLFDRLQTKTEVEQAAVELRSARYDLRDQRQLVALQVREALLEFRSSRARLRASTERLEAARRAWDAGRRRYELGAATFVELAQVRSQYTAARSAYIGARYSLLRARKLIEYHAGSLDPQASLAPRDAGSMRDG